MKWFLTLCTIGFGLAVWAEEISEFALDPVLYAQGIEQAGDPAFSTVHFDIRYLFANAENLARFKADPSPFEAQLGGACARMGALSGLGRTNIYTRHEGKLYLFASESCRSTFLANPQATMDPEAPSLDAHPDQLAAGRALVEQVVVAQGGSALIDALDDFEYVETRIGERNGKKQETVIRLLQTKDGKVRYESVVDGQWRWGVLSDGKHCQEFVGAQLGREIHPQGQRQLKRLAAATPLAVLRARQRPDFRAVLGDEAQLGDRLVRHLLVGFDGQRFDLAIGRDDHIIYAMSYRGHGPTMTFGDLTHFYVSHDPANANLPTGVRHRFGDKTGESNQIEVRLDQNLESTVYTTP
jgi:YHS domain-containing protein